MGHIHLLSDMNNLNGNFLDILEIVCSYRTELGNTLKLLIESFNSIFLQQFEVFYKNQNQKEGGI
jgi:hypothetical protein